MNTQIKSLSDAHGALHQMRRTSCSSVTWLAESADISRPHLASILASDSQDIRLSSFIRLCHAMGYSIIVTDTPLRYC